MKNLLIVDDSAETRNMYKLLLEYHFPFIAEAASGREAISIMKKMKIDLVISDLQMPNGDGHWLLGEVRTIAQNVRVIIISGDPMANESDLKHRGALAFFPKPFNVRQFLNLLSTLS